VRYHIIKASRSYEGRPYQGPASDYLPAQAETMFGAERVVDHLMKVNPVGWIIIDTKTGD